MFIEPQKLELTALQIRTCGIWRDLINIYTINILCANSRLYLNFRLISRETRSSALVPGCFGVAFSTWKPSCSLFTEVNGIVFGNGNGKFSRVSPRSGQTLWKLI